MSGVGPVPGTPRVEPRRPGFATPAGLWRIVLGDTAAGTPGIRAPGHRTAVVATRPARSVGPFTRRIAVAVHADRGALDEHARECIAAAALLAGTDTEVLAVVFGACHEDPAALGADAWVTGAGFDPRRYQPERALQWLLGIDRRHEPDTWLFPDRAADGDLGRRFGVATQKTLACHVVELTPTRLRLRAEPGEDLLGDHAGVMLLDRQVADPALPFVGLGRRLAEALPPALPAVEPGVFGTRIVDLGTTVGEPHALALEEADLILAAGNGVTDLALFEALAGVLGAATGASRVAVDDGRFPRTRQIGATGRTVAASTYLAVGISGAVQHLQGIKECRHVIAVNLDAAAPIVRRAALTVVEDSGQLMRALLALVTEARKAPPIAVEALPAEVVE